MRISLNNIRSDYDGFSSLIRLFAETSECEFEVIEIDMSKVFWFDANMCAPLGAILYSVSRNVNIVELVNFRKDVESILSKNGFLSAYGRKQRQDTYGTTIEYKKFDTYDGRYFGNYIEVGLIKRKGIPRMSIGLLKKFRESIFEIFNNAVTHSETQLGIFSCGQVFPKKNRIDFSIADLGIGIRSNIMRRKRLDLSPEGAIVWAASGNTTKTGKIPGGLGLKLLQEFISKNSGRIQIVSDKGYWELSNGKVSTKSFVNPFPGTVVNIEINTADKKSYCLKSEISPEDIF